MIKKILLIVVNTIRQMLIIYNKTLGIGDWGLGIGIGDWGSGIGTHPQSPIRNSHSPTPNTQSPRQKNIQIYSSLKYKR